MNDRNVLRSRPATVHIGCVLGVIELKLDIGVVVIGGELGSRDVSTSRVRFRLPLHGPSARIGPRNGIA